MIVPTYHRNDLLEKCLACLAPDVQSLPADQYEVIVTDDGVKTTAKEFVGDKFPWARWSEGPHRGPASNRNNGVKHALGAWLVFTDDDCLPKPDWLKGYAEAIKEGSGVYEGKTTCESGFPTPLFTAPVNETGGFLWSCNMMLRRDAFEGIGGFDESYQLVSMEDIDFRERLRDAGHTWVFVSEAVVDHPARRLVGPVKLAGIKESEYMFFARRGNPPKWLNWTWQILYVRLREIYRRPRGFDAVKAVPYAFVEAFLVAAKYPFWRKRYLPTKR
ncbi:MAG: glycosyltransferase [Chlorobia bacterium]|nr:glycosyltransferase [Fimbriimonadaceae bacterium]